MERRRRPRSSGNSGGSSPSGTTPLRITLSSSPSSPMSRLISGVEGPSPKIVKVTPGVFTRLIATTASSTPFVEISLPAVTSLRPPGRSLFLPMLGAAKVGSIALGITVDGTRPFVNRSNSSFVCRARSTTWSQPPSTVLANHLQRGLHVGMRSKAPPCDLRTMCRRNNRAMPMNSESRIRVFLSTLVSIWTMWGARRIRT